MICNKIFSYSFQHKLVEKPPGDVMIEIGKQFLGKPYKASTLEEPGEEHLVVNLRNFDCVTFVESVLALSLCVTCDRLSYDAFTTELQTIRYRNGIIGGYSSRLHYFSDWMYDNQKKGIIENITAELGAVPYKKNLNFMTTYRAAHSQLADDSLFSVFKTLEDSLRKRLLSFIPKQHIVNIQSKIENGDIIAITTNREGLDISHVGIAVKMNDSSLHYMHAPDIKGAVKISELPLAEMLAGHSDQTGIMVLRIIRNKE